MSPKTCQVWSRDRGARFAISREVSQRSGGPGSRPLLARERADGMARRNCYVLRPHFDHPRPQA